MPLNDSTDSTAYGYADSGQAFGMMTDTGGAKPENEAVNASTGAKGSAEASQSVAADTVQAKRSGCTAAKALCIILVLALVAAGGWWLGQRQGRGTTGDETNADAAWTMTLGQSSESTESSAQTRAFSSPSGTASPPEEEKAVEVALDAQHFPDANFRTLLSQSVDTDGDGTLSVTEIEAATRLDAADAGFGTTSDGDHIESAEGVQYLVNLAELLLRNNEVGQLDLTHNTQLEVLDVCGCGLEELDVTHNPKLKSLTTGGMDCNNALTSLDLTGNPELESLYVMWNSITSLDVSGNPELMSLYAGSNQLSSLDVSGNPKLTELDVNANSISALDVSANTQLTYLEASGNRLANIDLTHNTQLTTLSIGANQLQSIDLTHNTKLEEIDLYGNPFDGGGAVDMTDEVLARACPQMTCAG